MQWLDVLRREVESNGLGSVADVMGVSRAAVSQLVNDKYTGSLDNMKKRVEGAFFNRTVVCPVVGEIPIQQCFTNQRKKPGSNPMNLRFFKACRSGCVHSQQKKQFVGELIQSEFIPDDTQTAYNAERTLHLLHVQATSQAGDSDIDAIYIQLLENEVRNLAARINN
ncbi:helix-turn-helix domain-containing protein [Pseudidiomarina aestuarii]|uniref:helix-turn-helix domain-containing protein n=1 Tax=Pseudidiomarina aestuarii TaxID=624146 RepID=UPI003A97CC8D